MFWQPLHARKWRFPVPRTSRLFLIRASVWRALRTTAFSLFSICTLIKPFDARGCAITGQLGADLRFLKCHYSRPQGSGQSNYFIDLWEGQNLRTITQLNGLTNNHALFINCHGRRAENGKYVLYPHQSLLATSTNSPLYTMADLARIMGPSAAAKVHNIVLSACNAEGALDVKEIRNAFPHATNIIHCAAGELGYQAMFIQAMVNRSAYVKPIYEWAERNKHGEVEYYTGPAPTRNSKRFAPYVAELFTPGCDKPFALLRAGRELLEPQKCGDTVSKR